MRSLSWFGVAFLLLAAIFCQGQSQVQASQPAASDSQPTSKATDSTASKNSAADSAASAKPEDSGHHLHLRLGGISVGAAYSSGWAPYPYYPYYAYAPFGFYPYAFDSPWLWAPYWTGPPLNYPADDKGEVRLTAEPKTAQVFLDGAYAGTADRLKSMWLDPGAYDLSVTTPNRESFHQRIYVLTGKSLKITARLAAAPAIQETKP